MSVTKAHANNTLSNMQKLTKLAYLYLSNNEIEAIPQLPESLRIVHLQVWSALLTVHLSMAHIGSLWKTTFKKLKNWWVIKFSLTLSIFSFGLQNNNISSMTDETFCKGNNTHYIRYNLEEIRLENNPVDLAKYPQSFICLRSLPFGLY